MKIKDPKKYARGRIAYAVRRKIMNPTGTCAMCGVVGVIEHHHPDYSQPLRVVLMCKICHRKDRSRSGNPDRPI